ncbi:hypothetical protein BGZ63DRAFT_400583 [Mariannaea sp. PMI_226]|nr:hypothetical protein BGZ63DRAFT_400583 [Mariannaea sp. PMI_226]
MEAMENRQIKESMGNSLQGRHGRGNQNRGASTSQEHAHANGGVTPTYIHFPRRTRTPWKLHNPHATRTQQRAHRSAQSRDKRDDGNIPRTQQGDAESGATKDKVQRLRTEGGGAQAPLDPSHWMTLIPSTPLLDVSKLSSFCLGGRDPLASRAENGSALDYD